MYAFLTLTLPCTPVLWTMCVRLPLQGDTTEFMFILVQGAVCLRRHYWGPPSLQEDSLPLDQSLVTVETSGGLFSGHRQEGDMEGESGTWGERGVMGVMHILSSSAMLSCMCGGPSSSMGALNGVPCL